MTEEEILNKLNIFLKNRVSFKEECEVVYLMIEIRKILEREKNGKYSILRFYCDWTVHIQKDRITEDMKKIIIKVYERVKEEIENGQVVRGDIIKFIYMQQLQKEMIDFFDEIELSNNFRKDEFWLSFLKLFVKILENQPIVNYKSDIKIKTFCFIPSPEEAVVGVIVFKNRILGKNGKSYDYYKFANVY